MPWGLRMSRSLAWTQKEDVPYVIYGPKQLPLSCCGFVEVSEFGLLDNTVCNSEVAAAKPCQEKALNAWKRMNARIWHLPLLKGKVLESFI